MTKRVYTKLQLSGVNLTLRSDDQVSVDVSPISDAVSFERTLNGDLVRTSRSVFDKFAISISGSGINTPPLTHLKAGDYIEFIHPDHIYMPISTSGLIATYDRAMIDVEAFDQAGERIEPVSQPRDYTPLSRLFDAFRVEELRESITVTFPRRVHAARGRPILACLVIDFSISNEDASKEASWSLELEEM